MVFKTKKYFDEKYDFFEKALKNLKQELPPLLIA